MKANLKSTFFVLTMAVYGPACGGNSNPGEPILCATSKDCGTGMGDSGAPQNVEPVSVFNPVLMFLSNQEQTLPTLARSTPATITVVTNFYFSSPRRENGSEGDDALAYNYSQSLAPIDPACGYGYVELDTGCRAPIIRLTNDETTITRVAAVVDLGLCGTRGPASYTMSLHPATSSKRRVGVDSITNVRYDCEYVPVFN